MRNSGVPEQDVKSPCISVCCLDSDDVCFGCYRSAQEITDWFHYSDDEKRRVLRLAAERAAGSNPLV